MLSTIGPVLAIGAHPDDIEFGCFGTLCLLAETTEVHALIMSSCREDGWGAINGVPVRSIETRQALAPVCKSITILDLHHKDMEFASQFNVKAIEEVVQGLRPGLVLTQSKWDIHQDHRVLEQITLSACRRHAVTIASYYAPSATADFPANMLIDISSVFERKLQALALHKSQANQPYMNEAWLRQWHHEKAATNVGYNLVEMFHIYQLCWPPNRVVTKP